MTVAIELLLNVSLLIVFTYIYRLTIQYFHHSYLKLNLVRGLVFGLISVLSMVFAFRLNSGVIFDSRSIILSLSGLMGGIIPATIAVVISLIYRLTIGGGGALTGSLVIVFSAVVGVLARYVIRTRKLHVGLLQTYLFGLVVSVGAILLFFTLPREVLPIVIRDIWMPFLLIFPFVTVILYYMLSEHEMQFEHKKRLEESEGKYRALVEQSLSGIYIFDETGFRYVNKRMCEIFGYSQKEIIGHIKPTDLIYHNDRDLAQENIRKRMSGEVETVHYSPRGIRKDGSMIWIEIHGTHIMLNGKDAVTGTILDITKRKNAELEQDKGRDELLKYQETLKNLTTALTLAEEKHRRSIASDIHDYISQSLVFSNIKLSGLIKEAKDNNQKAALKEVQKHVTLSLQKTRSITEDLSPPVLYELGLSKGIQWLCEKTEREHQLETMCLIEAETVEIDHNKHILLFRIIQELLINVVKHAKASKAIVRISRSNHMMFFAVKDNGVGFAKKNMKQVYQGFGLFHIGEQVENLGGTMSVNSVKNEGTEIIITVPFSKHE